MVAINVILAILGLLSTLAAFGGETCKKGDEPLFNRITWRGFLFLFCLLSAFIIEIGKEIKLNEQKNKSELENQKLSNKIKSLQDSLEKSSITIARSSTEISNKVEEFKNSNCEGLEQAFKLAVNIPREYDDNVIDIDGREEIIIPGRITDPMELYWGDTFEYTFFLAHHLNL